MIFGTLVLSYAAWLLVVAIGGFLALWRDSIHSITAGLAYRLLSDIAPHALLLGIAYLSAGLCLIAGRGRWVVVGLCGITIAMIGLRWLKTPTLWSEVVALIHQWDSKTITDLAFDLGYFACHLILLIWCLSPSGYDAFRRKS